MAIFGAGSKWDEDELKDEFFKNNKFTIGWNEKSANDLYEAVSLLKVGDIVYLKGNRPGSRDIRVKGIGLVTKSFIQCLQNGEYGTSDISDWNSFFIKIKWIYKDEFKIVIPDEEGRLTNIRAATFYEEYLPYVQEKIIDKIIN
ncbi:hypothetical protein LXN10_13405 [Arcobacter sp. KX21116]|uniref:hypothetical protein n=1 Tax=Arcobacter iocasae TaxID=2906515 RepID=UPI0035D50903